MRQGSLLDIIPSQSGKVVGLIGLYPQIRARMNVVAKRYGDGRDLLVDAINEVADREKIALTSGGGTSITRAQLDKWLQPKAPGHEPSLTAIVCFCLATKDFSPLEPVHEALGIVVVPKADLRFLRLGKASVHLKKAKEEFKEAEAGI